MLRLVHPRPEGQGTRPSRRRGPSPTLSLTPEEKRHLRATLKNLRAAYGSWACLAEVMGMSSESLKNAAHSPRAGSPGVALRAAQAAGMSVEAVLGHAGTLTAAGRCTACGSRVGDRPMRAGGAS